MSVNLIEQIANAVLYEGYMLYPYRPSSVKNRQRWNFGVLYPRKYSEAQKSNDLWQMQTECLVDGNPSTKISVKVRFLHAIARTIGKLNSPVDESSIDGIHDCSYVTSLRLGDKLLQSWQEATGCAESIPIVALGDLVGREFVTRFSFPARKEIEPVRDSEGRVPALIVRTRQALYGEAVLSAKPVEDGIYKLRLKVSNVSAESSPAEDQHEDVLLHSLISTHSILRVADGAFISLLDPPQPLQSHAASCRNTGTWPVLVGEANQRDAMLSSPIILYDYPQVAPESPGDLFDGAEIDEILSLRIMTMTDDEKLEMRQSDDRARKILERTETLPDEQLMKLHGALRGLRTVKAIPHE
jgi:hydrogenase maturation protease